MTTLFIAKLSYETTNQSLEAKFSEYGNILSANVAIDRETKRSRGFGFVEFENDQDAQKAIAELDGTDFEGRQIAVTVARPRPNRITQVNRKTSQRSSNFDTGFQRR